MSHEFRTLTDHGEQTRLIQPIMRSLGSDIPIDGQGVVFAEMDEQGEVCAFQIVQTALFAEGLWARDSRVNLRRIWRMGTEWLKQTLGKASGRTVFTVATSEKMERAAGLMGWERVPRHWILMRRVF